MRHVAIGRYFSLFLKDLKIFLDLRLSLIVPLISLYHLYFLVRVTEKTTPLSFLKVIKIHHSFFSRFSTRISFLTTLLQTLQP